MNSKIYLRKSYNVQTIYNFVDFCLGSWWIKFGISARPCRAVISNFIKTVIFGQADMKGEFRNSSWKLFIFAMFYRGTADFWSKTSLLKMINSPPKISRSTKKFHVRYNFTCFNGCVLRGTLKSTLAYISGSLKNN